MQCCNKGIGDTLAYADWMDAVAAVPNNYPYAGQGGYTGAVNPVGSNFWSAFTQGLTASAGILGARYAVPQLNPGQLIQTGPNGTLMSQSNNGILGSSLLSTGGSSSLLIIGAIGLVAVLMMKH